MPARGSRTVVEMHGRLTWRSFLHSGADPGVALLRSRAQEPGVGAGLQCAGVGLRHCSSAALAPCAAVRGTPGGCRAVTVNTRECRWRWRGVRIMPAGYTVTLRVGCVRCSAMGLAAGGCRNGDANAQWACCTRAELVRLL